MKTIVRCARILTVVAALLARPAAARAQVTLPVLRLGDTLSGTLGAGDPQLNTKTLYHVYELSVKAGRRYAIGLRSTEFDAYLRIQRRNGPIAENLTQDDDGGGGNDALAKFRAPATEKVLVIVTSARSGEKGRYLLDAHDMTSPAPVVTPIAVGDSGLGRLVVDTAKSNDEDMAFEIFPFSARKGQVINFGIFPSMAFFAVQYGKMENGVFHAFGDSAAADSAKAAAGWASAPHDGRAWKDNYWGANPWTSQPITADGDYAVRVMLEQDKLFTWYLLPGDTSSLTPRDSSRNARAKALFTGDVVAMRRARVNETMIDTLATSATGRPFRDWTFTANQGDRVVITEQSKAFDSYLSVSSETPRKELYTNDDAPGMGNDSRIIFTAASTGTYIARASTTTTTSAGRYSLRIDVHSPVAHTLQRTRILSGAEVTGKLEETDALLEDASAYDEWIYTAREKGERIVIVLRTSDFDPFLSAGQMEDGKYVEFSSNDSDHSTSGEHVARLVVIAPKAGDLVIRANTFGPEQHGEYHLIVQRQ